MDIRWICLGLLILAVLVVLAAPGIFACMHSSQQNARRRDIYGIDDWGES